MQSHVILNNFGSRAQKCHRYKKRPLAVLLYVYFLISEYLSRYLQITLARFNKKTVLFYMTVFFFTF